MPAAGPRDSVRPHAGAVGQRMPCGEAPELFLADDPGSLAAGALRAGLHYVKYQRWFAGSIWVAARPRPRPQRVRSHAARDGDLQAVARESQAIRVRSATA